MQKSNISSVHITGDISRETFYERYVQIGRPVQIKGTTSSWSALDRWDTAYLEEVGKDLVVPIKTGNIAEGNRLHKPLSQYTSELEQYERQLADGQLPQKPDYLHDIPIFHLLPGLRADVEPFPLKFFPRWYWKKWWNYVQFFMGATGSYTPLHFDTLYTHNLFFQVRGRKKFLIISPDSRDKSYIYNWRWSRVDAREQDPANYPLFKDVEVREAVLEPGDILYLPPGTLHQVHGLSFSISFNIDWHTPQSARKGLVSFAKGAPLQNIYYNFLLSLGVCLHVPSRYIFPYYKSYLNYIS